MTFILDDSNNKVLTGKWIDKNHPENGVFRIYWVEDGNRISDSPEATGDEFKDKGAVAYEINYKDGKKNGISYGWRHNKTLKSEWNWKDDKPHGIHNEYYGTEDDYGVQNYSGKPRINWVETYKDGILHGKQTWWYRNGQKWKEEMRENGELKGRSTWWSCNGQKEYERFYLNGEFELSLGNYRAGWNEKHIHEVNKKYESGEIISISDGIIQTSDTKGVIFTFTKNDSTKFEWVIPKDAGGGRYIEWYKNGLMKKRAYWEGNKLTSSEFWDENGNEIIYPVDICTGVYLSSRYMYRSRIMTSNKSLADVCVVIQARLNSQRVPKKMIRDFNGTNLFSLVIDKVLKSEIISKKNFYVSVYEEELKDIAKDKGVQIYERSYESANNDNSLQIMYEWHDKLPFKYVIKINGCLPLLKTETIDGFIKQFLKQKEESLFGVIETKDYYFNKEGKLVTPWPKDQTIMNTKAVEITYKAAHALYASRMNLIKEDRFMGDFQGGIKLYPMNELECFDIDYEWQFKIAEKLYEFDTK